MSLGTCFFEVTRAVTRAGPCNSTLHSSSDLNIDTYKGRQCFRSVVISKISASALMLIIQRGKVLPTLSLAFALLMN